MKNHDSLTVALVTANHAQELSSQVSRVLEIVADFTPRFELLIIDDGSTDGTEEVAHELAWAIPQVRTMRHDQPLGFERATETAFEHGRGEIVIVIDGALPIQAASLRSLWEVRHERELVIARPARPPVVSRDLLKRLAAWGAGVEQAVEERRSSGVQLIRRDALLALRDSWRADASNSSSTVNQASADASHAPAAGPRFLDRRRSGEALGIVAREMAF